MLVAIVLLFLGGAAVGDVLARLLAPGSFVAEALSFFVLPLSFAISLQWWYGLAIVGLLARLAGFRRTTVPESRAVAPLPGSLVFLLVSSSMMLLTGIVVGVVSPYPLLLVAPLYWAVGTLHGVAGWRLARAGILLPPEQL